MKMILKQVLKMLGVAWLSLSGFSAVAQTAPAAPLKTPTNGNPLCPFLFTADPTAVEHEGRLYVYGSNDTDEYLARKKEGENTYDYLKTMAVMSSDDLVNWTFHGTIPAQQLCAAWDNVVWAPSVVSRVEDDGLTHFYIYFCNGWEGIGVLTSTSPTGPWTDPIGKPLIDRNTPGVGNMVAVMDAGVVIDDEGTGWLAFGGGLSPSSTGTELMRGNTRIVKLKPNMVEVDGSAVDVPVPHFFEANELNFMNGKWVYTYCSQWGYYDDWNEYSTTVPAPGMCSMNYMVSSDPLNPGSWKYVGEYFCNPMFAEAGLYAYGNNHTHLHKYQGNYYLLYHTTWLEKELNKTADVKTEAFRCIGINAANVKEKLPYIAPVKADNVGVEQLKALNPYEMQQAETMATCAGLEYENFFNAGNQKTNVAHENLVIGNIPAGAWTMVRGVDFGEKGASVLKARLRGRGQMEVRLDDISSDAVATIAFSSAGWKEPTVSLDPTLVKGKHDVYFYFPEGRAVMFDEWQFVENVSTAIQRPSWQNHGKAVPEMYDLNGRTLNGSLPQGVVIQRDPASGATRKVLVK